MNRSLLLIVVALGAGAVAGEFLSRISTTHRWAGRLFHRGELVAFIGRRGIFAGESVADEVVRVRSARTKVDDEAVRRAMWALRGEFGSDSAFHSALRADGIWKWQVRRMVAEAFRGEDWIERNMGKPKPVSDDDARRYYETHSADFTQPLRVRPRHIFLAAPAGTDNVEAKRMAMQEIVTRLHGGEDFATLAAAVSDDEATKMRGGDLNFLAANRVPPEFWKAIQSLPVNAPAAFVQSHLGFHAVQILDVRPARMMSFAEAWPEIEQKLNDRTGAVEALRAQLAGQGLRVGR